MFRKTQSLLSAAILGFGLFTSFVPSAFAADNTFQPRAFKAEYDLVKLGMALGNAEFTFQPLGGDVWHYQSELVPRGMARWFTKDEFREETTARFAPHRVVPLGYDYERTGDEPESASVAYDWDANTAVLTVDGKPQNIQLADDHQDRYSLVLSLMQAAARGDKNESYMVLDDDPKRRNYTLQGREKRDTHKGSCNALRYVQSDKGKRTVHYWLCPELNYAPIRIEQFRKGDSQLVMELESFTWQ
ncbi:conserved hypothetical protein [gamma proteobacterium HTCC5015]|nr:conserved hypothetical protein [gamma proteobacterium HTCC5015]